MPVLLKARRWMSKLIDQAAADREVEIKRLESSLAKSEAKCQTHENQAVEHHIEKRRLELELSVARETAAREHQRIVAELTSARHEYDKAVRALAVAQEENRRLWALCERDQARVAQERALFDRARAEAETVAAVAGG